MKMNYLHSYLLWLLVGVGSVRLCIAQTFSAEDFNSIIEMQDYRYGTIGNVHRFIKEKIPFYSVSGGRIEESAMIHNATITFRNDGTKEIFSIHIDEDQFKQNKTFVCTMEYCAPLWSIQRMEKEFRQRGYRYKKRKNYYVKRESFFPFRKEYSTVQIRKQSIHVSDYDEQPEIVFTTYKKFKKQK